MTNSREALEMERSNAAAHITFHKGNGCFITKKIGILLALFFVVSIITTAALVLYFTCCTTKSDAARSDVGELRNEKKIGDILDLAIPEDMNARLRDGARGKHARSVRLPTSIKPDSYEIKLVPFIESGNFTFFGEVKIMANVTNDSNNVTLHVNEIDIRPDSVSVMEMPGGRRLTVTKLGNDTDNQFLIIYVKENLSGGKQYEIKMNFTGILNDKLHGFYRSSYVSGNTTRWIATTQFQATDARRAFPCFDEPAMKAKFKLFIGRPENMSSLSNMPQINNGKPVDGLDGYVWDEYQQSVPMSTYLVAFVVSDFSNMKNERFSVWARDDAISQAKYSLDIGPKCLKYFEDYFDIDFPLPKVDMIAIPDFSAGAMENWGLITYRESTMLYEDGVSTKSNKQRVATVISHELAHQWFGNLVTPAWWSDLWLNEGFASYVEYLGVEAVEPSWKILEQFVIHETQNVFALDALQTSHPISVPVFNPDQINEIFDRISYGKGASIIRMMDHFLTSQVFKAGLTKYLKRHKFSNAEQDDLWAALTEQAHEDQVFSKDMSVKTIMDTWTVQTGFPVVTVERDYDKHTAVLTQEKFLLYKPTSNSSSDISKQDTLWWIPITFTSSDVLDFESTHPSHWMKQEKSITIKRLPSPDHWLIFNILENGFYRVNYDERNWKLLIDHLKNETKLGDISPINRAQLIDDSLNLARAGLLDYSIALNVTQYLVNENEYIPWKSAFTAFSYLDDMLVRTADYDKFKKYILRLVGKIYDKIGFTDEPEDPQLVTYKRILVLSWACLMGHKDCIDHSVKLFDQWMRMSDPDSNNPISPNLKSIVYCTAIRVGSEELWDFAWQRFLNSNVGSERDLLLEALGCSSHFWILRRYLDWSLSEGNGIRKQDIAKVFNAVSENPVGQTLTFKLLRGNWQKLKDYLGPSLFSITYIVRSSTKSINNKLDFEDLVNFAKENSKELSSANRAVVQAIEQGAANIRWMENNYNSIIKWLTNAIS